MSKQTPERPPVPAHLQFEERAAELRGLDLASRFQHIFETNMWASEESRSGPGSVLEQTAAVRRALPQLVAELGLRSMLDVPCGDFAWMRYVDLGEVRYIGADIVLAVAERNQREFGSATREFRALDLTRDPLPKVDLVFCRDCLVHLSFASVQRAIENLRRSGSEWLLTTTFPDTRENADIEDGDWRLLHFELAPFGFPPPLRLINEECSELDGHYRDKSLGLWRIADLPPQSI